MPVEEGSPNGRSRLHQHNPLVAKSSCPQHDDGEDLPRRVDSLSQYWTSLWLHHVLALYLYYGISDLAPAIIISKLEPPGERQWVRDLSS